MNPADTATSSTKTTETSTEDADPSSGNRALVPYVKPGLWTRIVQMFLRRTEPSLRENLRDALDDHHGADPEFGAQERAMLHNILRFREVRIEDIMVPRTDIEAVEMVTPLSELLIKFERSGHSRMPVFGESLDDPRGMIHIRDVVAHLTKLSRQKKRGRKPAKTTENVKSKSAATTQPVLNMGNVNFDRAIGELNLIRDVLFVPPSMLAADLMAKMKASRTQMALVIDEYGGTDGLVSLEDIVEEVVGEIEDEHDDEEALITQSSPGIYVVDAKAEIEEVAKMIGNGFDAGKPGEDVDTIGGLIFNVLNRVPVRGEVVQAVPGYEFQVMDADPRRVKRVRIVQKKQPDRRRRVSRASETG